MKRLLSIICAIGMFGLSSSFTTNPTTLIEDVSGCYVTITYTNSDGESWSESWYSSSRTSAADCAAGAQALANDNFMMSSDFSRSPVIFNIR